MSDNSKYIPRYLDEPMRIVIFTIDEFILAFALAISGYVFFHELFGILFATVGHIAYTRFKRKEASAFLKRVAYSFNLAKPFKVIPRFDNDKFKGWLWILHHLNII